MFRSGEIEAIATALDAPMRELEIRIMQDIVRRIRINGEITAAADWQLHRLYELGESKREIKKLLSSILKLNKKEMQHLYKEVLRRGYARDGKLYRAKGLVQIPFEENHGLQQLLESVAEQTVGTLQNITQSLGFAKRMTDGKLHFVGLADYYQQTLDAAMLDIASGAFDYNTVLGRTATEMTHSGLRTVDYATGWKNRVDVAARRAVMTGMSQLTAKVNEDHAEQLGTEYFEVTCHLGARPEHQVWQGRVYSRQELASICGLGTVTGLCGANCYHDYYPFLPGISERAYSDEELDQMAEQERTPKEFGDRQYTTYEALQRQRALETTMRAQRQRIKLLEDGGADEQDIINARGQYRVTSYEYTRFSKAMGLPQQRERVTIDGLGNIGVGKTKGAKEIPEIRPTRLGAEVTDRVTPEERMELLARGLDISGGSGIIGLRDDHSIYHAVTEEAIQKVPMPAIFSTNEMNVLHQKASRDLLREVAKQGAVGTEVSIVYDANMMPIEGYGYRIGTVGSVKVDVPPVPFHAFHNHSSGETFSFTDLTTFLNNEEMISISAVGNNGNLFCILRTADCDVFGYRWFLMNKSKAIIFSANGVDFTLEKLTDKRTYEMLSHVVSKLDDQQRAKLGRAIKLQIEKCLKGGEQYGFKYKVQTP